MTSTWSHIHAICDSTVETANPVASLTWDLYTDLLWVGYESGRVASYYGKGLQRYTSFKAHKDNPIRQIRAMDKGVLCLSQTSLQMRDRKGLVRFNLSNEQTADLCCMTPTALPNGELLVAGRQDDMLVVSVPRGTITRTIEGSANTIVMRTEPNMIFCGSLLGHFTIRDPRTMKVEQRVQAHTAMLADMDVTEHLLVTCGFSQRQNHLIVDPLKVFDLRMSGRSVASIPFPMGPSFVKMNPTDPSSCLVVSKAGQFQMCNVSAMAKGTYTAPSQIYQVPSNSLTAMDFSSTGQTIVFGDRMGVMFQYADRENYNVSFSPRPVVMPDPALSSPLLITEESPLSSIGMPYYTEPLLSVWSSDGQCQVGQPPVPIDEEVLRNMKTIDFVGYARNPGHLKRNLAPRQKKSTMRKDVPKFISEQERELMQANNGVLGDDTFKHSGRRSSSLGDLNLSDTHAWSIRKNYGRVEIQYSKFGVDDFDFGHYNATPYGGLETHIRNSYCNSILQLMYFTQPLKTIAFSHIRTACPKNNCLLCELGFLFCMLRDSDGLNCQATNFLRAFGTIPQALALGLFEPEKPDSGFSYSTLIQNFTRFIMEQLHQDGKSMTGSPSIGSTLEGDREDDKGELSPLQQLFGMETMSSSTCGNCGHEIQRKAWPFVVDLLYSKKVHPCSFINVLKWSLCREGQTKAWCPQCRQYHPTITKKSVLNLPPVMMINSGLHTIEHAAQWWHHDGANADGTLTNEAFWLPDRFAVKLNGLDMTITSLPEGADIPPDFTDPRTCAVYELSSTVLQVQVDEDPPHLVSQIKIPTCDLDNDTLEMKKSPWYLFNDFLVKRIPPEDVFSFNGKWKVPALVQYKRVDLDTILDLSSLPNEVDYSLLFKDASAALNPNLNPKHEVLQPDELPKRGTLVAIDAEFVALNAEVSEIHSDGTKSLIRPSTLTLARVSVLRGEGEKEKVPFIDDYIATTEPVMDYLTEYSGIEADDLDPKTTQHTLVPLKVAYKKLRMLVDLGCVFIGHGLNKDFRIINILVPQDQIIDTVDIYHIRNRHRKISLRFLAWHLLDQEIQSQGHDSIEDAYTALVLYKKYLEYRDNGTFGDVLEGVYDAGQKANWLKTPKVRSTPPTNNTLSTSVAARAANWTSKKSRP